MIHTTVANEFLPWRLLPRAVPLTSCGSFLPPHGMVLINSAQSTTFDIWRERQVAHDYSASISPRGTHVVHVDEGVSFVYSHSRDRCRRLVLTASSDWLTDKLDMWGMNPVFTCANCLTASVSHFMTLSWWRSPSDRTSASEVTCRLITQKPMLSQARISGFQRSAGIWMDVRFFDYLPSLFPQHGYCQIKCTVVSSDASRLNVWAHL